MRKKKLNKVKGHKIGLYVRVSTEEQASNEEGSIKNQEQRLRQQVELKNQDGFFGDVERVFIDRAKSGKDTNRPELQRMLRAIRSGDIDFVMATELSRISRSIKDFSNIWELMQDQGCGFYSLRESFDSSSAAGEMVLFTVANIAQFERRQTSERIAANFKARAKRGLYNGGRVPFGYSLISGKPGYLQINQKFAPTIRKCFEAFLEQGTLSSTAKWLNENGYYPVRNSTNGGKPLKFFTFDNLHRILKNKSYIGIKTYEENGEIKEVKAVWPAIVDEFVFYKVQKTLKKNHSRKKPLYDLTHSLHFVPET